MNLCIVTAASIRISDEGVFTDKKNIMAIQRYLSYFDRIHVIGRKPYKKNIYNHIKFQTDDRLTFEAIDYDPGVKGVFFAMRNVSSAVYNGAKDSDVILCWALPESYAIVKSAKKLSKKAFIYVGGCQFNSLFYMNSLFRKIVSIPVFFMVRRAIMHADYVHYVTQKALQRRYPTKGKSVSASYVSLYLDDCSEILEKRMQECNEKPIKNLGIIGYLNPIKGIDTAIKALSDTKGDYTLRILGGGDSQDYKKLAEELGISDKVFFEGTLAPGQPVREWLANIDLYLQPSVTEGLPRATLEAMSLGCPVISTGAMGLKEIVESRWRHKRGDYKTLADLIDIVNNSTEIRKSLVNHSIKTAKEYDRSVLDQRLDIFFKEMKVDIAKNPRGGVNE